MSDRQRGWRAGTPGRARSAALVVRGRRFVVRCLSSARRRARTQPAISADGRESRGRGGPAPPVERRALLTYVTNQNDVSRKRRWVPVWLLLGGLVIGFVGNVLSRWP